VADFKIIATAYPDAASNTSLTSAFPISGGFSHFAIMIPAAAGFCATATCNVRVLGSDSQTGTFYPIGYSNNPATTTSGFALWESAGSCAVGGAIVICEALQFSPGWAKLQFVQTATAASGFKILGRKFD
jgi:hypothetical protein